MEEFRIQLARAVKDAQMDEKCCTIVAALNISSVIAHL